jgi:hypothetical protein
MPRGPDRSLARIEVADLLRLAALAAYAEAELFTRNPHGSGRYAVRLLGRAPSHGAALHYVNQSNGVKDFDVWSFYAQHDDWPFPARWGGTREPSVRGYGSRYRILAFVPASSRVPAAMAGRRPVRGSSPR